MSRRDFLRIFLSGRSENRIEGEDEFFRLVVENAVALPLGRMNALRGFAGIRAFRARGRSGSTDHLHDFPGAVVLLRG
jgi:hypothetical protein